MCRLNLSVNARGVTGLGVYPLLGLRGMQRQQSQRERSQRWCQYKFIIKSLCRVIKLFSTYTISTTRQLSTVSVNAQSPGQLPTRRRVALASLLEVEPRSAAARLRMSYDASMRGFLGNALGWQLAAHARHSGEQCGWQH